MARDGPEASSAEPHREELERGREAYARRAWASAHEALSRADAACPLGVEDLEPLALAAYLVGRDADYLELLQRLYHAQLSLGSIAAAARSAFWLGLRLSFRGEVGQASGWLARAQRLVESKPGESAEQGYLLLAAAQQQLGAGDLEAADASATVAARLGDQFSDGELLAIARHLIGLVRLQRGQVQAGLSLLDEVMVSATGGELSPLVTGLIYCGVIEGCQEVYALGRAREWTWALAEWCGEQPEMVAFAGICSVHRAEILQLHGAWADAFAETERALERCRHINRRATAAAHYQRAELLRLRGELAAAEQAYESASQCGCEPQPGLALLRLAQGRTELALRSIEGALGATHERSRRARLLPAYAEILLASGNLEGAASACRELDEIAGLFDSALLRTLALHARGALELVKGHPLAALELLRPAHQRWQELELPYLAARARALLAKCCRALHDEDGERLEREAARSAFAALGALPDVSQLEASEERPPAASGRALAARAQALSHPLTARELEVLRLVAAGNSNKAVASALGLSEKTIERHVSNIFTKLDVGSRTAAAAFAYEHGLL